MRRRIGVLACGALGLTGCTRPNPAYEGGGGATSSGPGTVESSSTRDAADDTPEAGTGQGSGRETTGDETGPVGDPETTGATTAETEDDPPEPPEPPQVGPFGEPVRLDINSLVGDDDPTLPSDMLELYFASFRGESAGLEDLWVSQRESLQDPWGSPEPLTELNTVANDNTPEISPDGLMMLLSSDRDTGILDIYMTTRRERGSEWSTPVRIADLSTNARDVCSFPTADGQHVYSCAGPGAQQDLLRFDRAGEGWAGPFPVLELNTLMIDCAPWLDPSNRLIVFVSDRPGSLGSVDLWMATRPSADVAFEPPVVLPVVNSHRYDDDPWLSPDGDTLFFSSNRQEETSFDLYMAERVPD